MFSVLSIFTNQYSSKMNKELISIIVPVYNVERFLVQCLTSCVEQTYTNIEIICINDCSTDNTRKIIQSYINLYKNLKVIDHEQNRKLGATRNTGRFAAKGECIYGL